MSKKSNFDQVGVMKDIEDLRGQGFGWADTVDAINEHWTTTRGKKWTLANLRNFWDRYRDEPAAYLTGDTIVTTTVSRDTIVSILSNPELTDVKRVKMIRAYVE